MPATVSSLHVSVLDTAMHRTSIAAVVLGCFYLCPLDCDASVIVVDCAAVETGCMLQRYKKVLFSVCDIANAVSVASILLLLLLLRKDVHFYFLVEALRLPIVCLSRCAAAAGGACVAYNICTEAERGAGYCFLPPRFCPLHCDASDVYCCCCSLLLLFMPFRLRCFGYRC